jgi:NAD(P)H-dependent FMN reductase
MLGVNAVPLQILVLYGSYRSDRKGIRLAQCICEELRSRGDAAVLIDAKAIGLPMMDRMYKEYAPGEAPTQMEALATKIRQADAFAFIVGEYNWGVQPGLKNLTDHFLKEWFWRPAAIASYSVGRTAGVRAALAWRSTLSEMGMVVVSSTLAVGPIEEALDAQGRPTGEQGRSLRIALPLFLEDLAWWAEAAKAQRARQEPPY